MGNGDGEAISFASVCGDPRGNFFCRGDRGEELKLDREFSIAIPRRVRLAPLLLQAFFIVH
jgi:hypothetical protein